MAKSDNSILWLVGLGVGGYFLYQWLYGSSATATPTTTTTPGTTPTGTVPTTPTATAPITPTAPTPAPPQQSAFNQLDAIYTRLKAAVQGDPNFTGTGDGTAGTPYHWNFYLARVWDGTLSGTSVPSSPISGLPDPATVFQSLAVQWVQQQNMAQQASGSVGPGLLPETPMIPATITDFLAQPMTALVYWGQMAPALQQMVPGLSGIYGGLGLYGALGNRVAYMKRRYA